MEESVSRKNNIFLQTRRRQYNNFLYYFVHMSYCMSKTLYCLMIILIICTTVTSCPSELKKEKQLLFKKKQIKIISQGNQVDIFYREGINDWNLHQKLTFNSCVTEFFFSDTLVIVDNFNVLHLFNSTLQKQWYETSVLKLKRTNATIQEIKLEAENIYVQYKYALDIYQRASDDWKYLKTVENKEVKEKVQNTTKKQIRRVEERILQSQNYGLKGDFTIDENGYALDEGNRKIIDLVMGGDYLVAIEQYTGFITYTLSEGTYSFVKKDTQNRFITCATLNPQLNLLVIGSYDRKAYVYEGSASGFTSLTPIQTNSQILSADLNSDGFLLLGHMNGDISPHEWNVDSSTFSPSAVLSNEGGRTYFVKACDDGRKITIIEQLGWFYLKVYSDSNSVLQNQQLTEFLEVHAAVPDNCQAVFISSTMNMHVEVYTLGQDNQFSVFKTYDQTSPSSTISLNPDGDAFLVARHTTSSSALYKYNQCTEDYELEKVITEGSDDYANAISGSSIALGNQDGNIQVYDYSYSMKTCEDFGNKLISEISDITSTTEIPRTITSISGSGNYLLIGSKYSSTFLYQYIDKNFTMVKEISDITFISDGVIVSSLSMMVIGSFFKTLHVYHDEGAGQGYQPKENITVTSQVTCVHMSEDGGLLAGLRNGDVVSFSYDGSSFQNAAAETISHQWANILGVKMCPSNKKLVLMEYAGVFTLAVYSGTTQVEKITTELEGEFVQPFFDASTDCSIIAISGISLQKVIVLIDNEGYEQLDTIEVEELLEEVDVDEEGDFLVVASITYQRSYIYQYRNCVGAYELKKNLTSGTYDQATAITSQFIANGNVNGVVKISEFIWAVDGTCPTASASLAPKVKNNRNSSNFYERQSDGRKLMGSKVNGFADKSNWVNDISPSLSLGLICGTVVFALAFIFLKRKTVPMTNDQ